MWGGGGGGRWLNLVYQWIPLPIINHIHILGMRLELSCNGGYCRESLFNYIPPHKPPLQANSSPRLRTWPILCLEWLPGWTDILWTLVKWSPGSKVILFDSEKQFFPQPWLTNSRPFNDYPLTHMKNDWYTCEIPCSVLQVYFRFIQQTHMGLVPRSQECSSWYAQSVQDVVQQAATNQLKIVILVTEVHIAYEITLGIL